MSSLRSFQNLPARAETSDSTHTSRPLNKGGNFTFGPVCQRKAHVLNEVANEGSTPSRSTTFTITETPLPTTLRQSGQRAVSPKGLGWDGNKPLMRNRMANECHPRWVYCRSIFSVDCSKIVSPRRVDLNQISGVANSGPKGTRNQKQTDCSGLTRRKEGQNNSTSRPLSSFD
jgi:hypothetical protein